MGTKSEASDTAKKVTRKIKKHVSRKGVWRMCDEGPPGRGVHTIDGKWSVCCCALVDVYQSKVSKNPSASP